MTITTITNNVNQSVTFQLECIEAIFIDNNTLTVTFQNLADQALTFDNFQDAVNALNAALGTTK